MTTEAQTTETTPTITPAPAPQRRTRGAGVTNVHKPTKRLKAAYRCARTDDSLKGFARLCVGYNDWRSADAKAWLETKASKPVKTKHPKRVKTKTKKKDA